MLLAFLALLLAANGQRSGSGADAGAVVYRGHGCTACHGESGEGAAGPALAGNPKIWNPDYVIEQILNGGGGMPGFARQLSDEQLAAVASHVRTSWGNDLEPVDAEAVASRREGTRISGEGAARTEVAGSQIFAWNCMICHGVNGEGGVGPAFAGNQGLANTSYVVAQIQLGGGGMPPFAPVLDSAEVAAVASYIRTAWGNELGEIEAEHVRVQWEGLGNTPTGRPTQPAESGNTTVGGEELYASLGCAGCHSSEGAGGIGPPLDGNPALADPAFVVTTIRDGRRGMPAFGDQLDDRQLEALASFVRTAWSNDFGPVSLEHGEGLPSSLERSQVDPVSQGPATVVGEQLYGAVGCAGCHSSEGAGGIGPPLDGNPVLQQANYVVDTILTGGEQMPAFAEILTDDQVAALASHVRTAWSNDYGVVETEQVTNLRPKLRPTQRR